MALSKTITGEKGQVTQYHRILVAAQVYIDGKQRIDVNIASYASADYRNAEKAGGEEMILNNTGISLPIGETEDFSRATLYTRIKAEVSEFADAEDC